MRTLTQYIAEARKQPKKNFGRIDKRFYVIIDPYFNNNISIVTQDEISNYINGANGVDDEWDAYEDFSPKNVLYSTNEIKDAVNWVLKYKKINPKTFLDDLWDGNDDCDDPEDYVDNLLSTEYDLQDSDKFFWAVLTGKWDNGDIDGENN